MTTRDAQRAIEPGSVPHGERGALEQGLSEVLSNPQRGVQPVPGGGPSPLAIPEDPIGALLSGEVAGDDLPSTAGLSVGPGPGPAQTQDVMLGTRAERTRQIAQEASSPMIRAAARNELRRMARQAV